jgi:hypothetical protein
MPSSETYQLTLIRDLLERLLGDTVARPDWYYAPPAGGIVDTNAVTIAPAVAADKRNFIRSVQVINQAAGVETEVVIRKGSGGPVIHRISAKEAGGGYAARFDPALHGDPGELLEVVALTDASETYFNAQGFIE